MDEIMSNNNIDTIKKDVLEEYILIFGIENAVKKSLYDSSFNEKFGEHQNELCELALFDLGYNLNKLEYKNRIELNYAHILYRLLKLTNNNYEKLKNHDEALRLSIIKKTHKLTSFILKTRNHFEGILMLLVAINNQINKSYIDISLLAKYLLELEKYNINYLENIKHKIDPYILLQLTSYI
jgi:hypothetical protein